MYTLGKAEPDNEHTINLYLKCKHTYENAGFCILCIDDFKMIKIFQDYRDFSPRNVTGANRLP